MALPFPALGSLRRVIVCGDREWKDTDTIRKVLSRLNKNCVIVHGACRGADNIADEIAKSLGMTTEGFKPAWQIYKKGAGPIRNSEMLKTGPNAVIAFHSNITASKGTRDMMQKAINAKVPTLLVMSNGMAIIYPPGSKL